MHPQRFNRTNFVTQTVAAKIIEAMKAALNDGLQHYVENKRGQRWLRVCIKPVQGCGAAQYTYEFLAGNGQDVGHLILEALFVWNPTHERMFSMLVGTSYGLTAHPYTTARRRAIQEKRKAVERDLKDRGVTSSFRTDGGITLLGRWKRSWLGRKVFEVLADAKGNPVPKPYALDREAMLYGTVQGFFA
uniref:Membrane protein n=2 Tax=unclassified Ghunavirus TaxID=2749940 RepID=A0AAU6VZ98_9CAUD